MTLSLSRLIFSRLTIWLAVACAGGYYVYNLKNYVKFGIDLVGGTYMTLEVQLEKAREAELVEKMQDVYETLKKNDNILPINRTIKDDAIVLNFESIDDAHSASTLLHNRDPRSIVNQNQQQVFIKFSEDYNKKIDNDAVESNILAINTRINQFGVGEVLVARRGHNRIIVELPNVHNPQEAKALIGRAALLEIKLVEDSASSEEDLLNIYGGDVPDGTMIVGHKVDSKNKEFFLVDRYTEITGKLLKTARMGFGGKIGTDPVVEFEFKPLGAQRFYDLTSENMGRRVAIIIDGEVITAPVVQAAIGAQGVIQGNFTPQEAQQTALLLRSGAFVAPVKFDEERHIGPSLGAESIHQGLVACGVGLVLLFIFSLTFYKLAGLLAFIVLLYNLLLVLFMLWLLGATLTLPGIAGMVLTVGMAIDASILVYERIKEELAMGVDLRRAIQQGFSGAFSVILDANVTNLLIALVLYKLGSGPIQGFAVTMIVGMISTLITGLWLLKSFFSFALDVLRVKKIRF